MINVVIVGEGQTEETFVRDVLVSEFAADDIFLYPQLIPTSAGTRGGALTYPRVLRYLRNTLRQRQDTYVTTFFDLYALRPEFPGFSTGHQLADPLQRATAVEQEFGQAVIAEAAVPGNRFFAYIQPFEFEALLFVDVSKLIALEPGWEPYAERLQAARDGAVSPEHINDGPTTHPSERLKVLNPTYRKTLHGPLAVESIGLTAIAESCAHFAAWFQHLRALPPLP
jgi:Domain of unknown function (DUF4276)